jgi:hypothetical protein
VHRAIVSAQAPTPAGKAAVERAHSRQSRHAQQPSARAAQPGRRTRRAGAATRASSNSARRRRRAACRARACPPTQPIRDLLAQLDRTDARLATYRLEDRALDGSAVGSSVPTTFSVPSRWRMRSSLSRSSRVSALVMASCGPPPISASS